MRSLKDIFREDKKEPDKEIDILNWIEKIGVDGYEIAPHHWLIQLEHKEAKYSVSIKEDARWFIYASKLIDDIQGKNAAEFYRRILDLNATLNLAYIARENEQLVLIRNDFTEDINEEDFIRTLVIFHRTHEYVYGYILKEAQKLGLKFYAA